MKFTKEEISLCKQVAEKHREEIKYGDWYLVKGESQVHLHNNFLRRKIAKFAKEMSQLIPLWTISDCLEFFKERELRYYIVTDNHSTTITIFNPKTDSIITQQSVENSKDSLGIACLKAVLAVLRDKS